MGCSHSCQLSLLLQGLEPTWVSGGFSQAQSLERGSGLGSREAGRQGYSLETGRTLGAWEVIWNQHTEGPGSHRRVCASQWAGSRGEGHLQGMLWAWVAAPHSLHSAPSRPLRSRGSLSTGLPGGQCVWDRQGRRQSGRGGPDGGGWASVVLKERQEVIITIARQVRGVQV